MRKRSHSNRGVPHDRIFPKPTSPSGRSLVSLATKHMPRSHITGTVHGPLCTTCTRTRFFASTWMESTILPHLRAALIRNLWTHQKSPKLVSSRNAFTQCSPNGITTYGRDMDFHWTAVIFIQ